MGEWKPIGTMPRNQVCLVSDDNGLMQFASLVYQPSIGSVKKGRWPWSKPKQQVKGGYWYWVFALPTNGRYAQLNMRADSEYEPIFWQEIPAPPPHP